MGQAGLLNTMLARLDHIMPIIGLVVGVLFSYQILRWTYNIFLHPLRKFPGPTLSAASHIPYIKKQLAGELQHYLIKLHEKYGEVVRVLPNELSFSSAAAWKDIYSHRKSGQPTLQKFPHFYAHPGAEGAKDIIFCDDATHSRMRRIFSNAFSDRALKLQESLFLKYVDTLVEKLRSISTSDPGHKFDMVKMYNYTTFDVMGDLTFGEPLNLLNDTKYHGWIASMFANFRFGAYLHSIRYYPAFEKLLLNVFAGALRKQREEHGKFSSSRVDRRLEKQEPKPDIWGLVLARDEESGLTKEEMYKNASLFMLAGTETTATLLSGLTFHLLKNPDKLKNLVDEIRGIKEEGGLTIERLQALPYLNACIEEGLRMYPPVSNGLPRVVPAQGVIVDGHAVPGGSIVYVHQLSTYRNPKNFKDPYKFIPERWLSEEFAGDKKHALNPFSIGPRNCIGRNMAYHEIRVILAKVLWNFNLTLCPETGNFANTKKIYVLWEKPALLCTVEPVSRL